MISRLGSIPPDRNNTNGPCSGTVGPLKNPNREVDKSEKQGLTRKFTR